LKGVSIESKTKGSEEGSVADLQMPELREWVLALRGGGDFEEALI
jgi:hypothetical protein